MAITFTDISARAGTYPSQAKDFGKTLSKFAESVQAYIDSGAVTMTNKTFTSPVLTTPQINDTSADHQYIFAVNELVADRTVTLPLLTGNDEFVFAAHAVTLTNKSIDSDNNTITNIVNADIKATAAIASTKLAAFDHTTAGVDKVVKVAVVKWNQATDGTVSAGNEFSTGVTLPDNAIVLRVVEDMMADSTNNGGTVQLLVGTSGTAISAANTADGTPEVVVSSTGLGTKTSAATELFVAVASEDLDDGDLMYFVEYVVSV